MDTEIVTEFTNTFEFAIYWKVIGGESFVAVDRVHLL